MITIQEASKRLGVTPKTLRLWEKEGKIQSYKTEGGHRRYQ
jgi:putative resolvase